MTLKFWKRKKPAFTEEQEIIIKQWIVDIAWEIVNEAEEDAHK